MQEVQEYVGFDKLAEVNQVAPDAAVAEFSAGKLTAWLTVQGKQGQKSDNDPGVIGKFLLNINKDQHINLGTEMLLMPVSYRHKAVDFADRKKIIISTDRDSEEFKRIKGRADTVKGMDAAAIYGTEFLCLLYHNEAWRYTHFFFSNQTQRKSTEEMVNQVNKLTKMTIRLIKGDVHSWHGFYINPSATPFSALPPAPTDLLSKINEFKTEKPSAPDQEPVKSNVDR